MDRREFFQVTGGIAFAFAFPAHSQSEKSLGAWVRIAPDGTITYVNQRWLDYCGLTAEQNATS